MNERRHLTRSIRRRGAALLLAGGCLAVAAGCGSTTDAAAPAATTSTTPPTTAATTGTTAASASGTSEFCGIFQVLSGQVQAGGNEGARFKDEDGWNQGIDTVERIAASAPAEISAQANTYVQMVKDRKELAATYDYGTVPADATAQFIQSHMAMQQQVNQLLSYAKTHCTGVT